MAQITADRESVSSASAGVRIRNVSFRYRGESKRALSDVSLDVAPGEFVVVMGASGAGKTTMCLTVNGLIPRILKGEFSGQVQVAGNDVGTEEAAGIAQTVGVVFQDFEAQLFSTNAALEVAFGPENLGVEREEIRARVTDSLREVHLEGFEGRQPAALSGGQKQRLAIASVLSMHPSVLCFDEPTTDLDPVGKRQIFDIAGALQRAGSTLIVVEHETPEVVAADRIVILDRGQVVLDGPADAVLREVELFQRTGIMALQIPEFFARMGYPVEDRPTSVDAAVEEFRRGRLSLDQERYEDCVRRDRQKADAYGDTVINVDSLDHRYATGLLAVDGANLNIRRGEFVALLGQNGSGKTTLVKHLNGLLKPTAGSVEINGMDTKSTSMIRLGEEIGFVFQNPDHQIFSDTVGEEVSFALRMRKMGAEEIAERVAEALKAVGLEGAEDEDPFTMSKGERQRVAVASVLALRPNILVLDEPTTGLDYREQVSMMELIKRLNENGATVLVITHTMWVVCEYAHRVVVMRDGRVVTDDTPRAVFADEDGLTEMTLKPPPTVALGNALGRTLLSVDEMEYATVGQVSR